MAKCAFWGFRCSPIHPRPHFLQCISAQIQPQQPFHPWQNVHGVQLAMHDGQVEQAGGELLAGGSAAGKWEGKGLILGGILGKLRRMPEAKSCRTSVRLRLVQAREDPSAKGRGGGQMIGWGVIGPSEPWEHWHFRGQMRVICWNWKEETTVGRKKMEKGKRKGTGRDISGRG